MHIIRGSNESEGSFKGLLARALHTGVGFESEKLNFGISITLQPMPVKTLQEVEHSKDGLHLVTLDPRVSQDFVFVASHVEKLIVSVLVDMRRPRWGLVDSDARISRISWVANI